MSALPLWKPATQTLRLLVPAIAVNTTLLPDGLTQARKPWPPVAVAGASRRGGCDAPTPAVSVGGIATVVGPLEIAPVQPLPAYSVCVTPAVLVPVRPVTD